MDQTICFCIVQFLKFGPWLAYAHVLMFFVLSLLYGRFRLHVISNTAKHTEHFPGITILKPLMGVDTLLEHNLESHFNLQYPTFEILFCVADDQDPVIDLIRKLQKRHPNVDSRLFIGGRSGILNPLINSMAPAYEASKYDILWVSTSRIQVNTDMMMDMVAKLSKPKVALVHQMPFTTDQRGLAAAVEKVYFGATAGKYFLSFHVLGISCFTGMSYMVKKIHLEDDKGLAYFGKFIAEDFVLAKYLHDKGFQLQVAAFPAQQNVASTSIVDFKNRMVRWLRLRLNVVPLLAGFFEFVTESVPLGIYAAWSAYTVFGLNPFLWFCGHWAVWLILDYIQLKVVQNGPLPFSFSTYIVAWLIRELLYTFIYIEAICNVGQIKWGQRTYYSSDFKNL